MVSKKALFLLALFFTVLSVQAISLYGSFASFDSFTCATSSHTGHGKRSCVKSAQALHINQFRRRRSSEEITLSKERLARSMIPSLAGSPSLDFSFVVVQDADEPSPPSIHLPADTRPPCLSA